MPNYEQKLAVPSDTAKKHLANCGVVLQYLREAGVPLHDDDGMMIVGDDIVSGDKELTLSLLWNMFVHLQACPFCKVYYHICILIFYCISKMIVGGLAAASSHEENNAS